MARILIIDDNEDVRELLADVLEREGHHVFAAKDGDDGLEKYHVHCPDLVITDVDMPNRPGPETISALRATAPELPIIALSGSVASDQYYAVRRQLGAARTLAKPFNLIVLVKLIRSVLNTAPVST